MPQRPSLNTLPAQDPLSLVHDRPAYTKPRSKSNASAEEHFTGIVRFGRVVASIFDRGRRLKYDYQITQPEPSSRRHASAPKLHPASSANRSEHSSRSSSMTVASTTITATSNHRLSVPLSTPSSRRASSESATIARTRRGGMSMSAS